MGKQHWTELKPLLKTFFPVAWMGHLGLGLAFAFWGPALPFLASQVGVGHQQISFLFTARSLGIMLACMTSGQAFGSSWMAPKRLLYLASSMLLISTCFYAIPFIKDFTLMLTLTAILAFGLGSFDVADNGLMNMMVGPELSKPLVQSLHAFVAFGNVLVAFIMPQMLPESSQGSNEDLCAKLKNPDQFQELDLDSSVMSDDDWPILVLPSILVGFWLFLVAMGFVILFVKGFQLPSFHSIVMVHEKPTPSEDQEPKCQDRIILSLGVLFFFLIGVESFFHSQTYTFGLCGPLKLSSATAGYLNGIYFAPYLIGRLVSVPLSTVVTPTVITLAAIMGCVISALILATFGAIDVLALFIATGSMDFFGSFLFGSGINWLNGNVKNMSSRELAFIFVGCNLANCLFPALASKLFNDYGPVTVFYLTLACYCGLFLCFCSMIFASKCQRNERQSTSVLTSA